MTIAERGHIHHKRDVEVGLILDDRHGILADFAVELAKKISVKGTKVDIDFVQRAIIYFGYAPKIIQTDNGSEFTHFTKTKRIHPFDKFCGKINIEHKLIRPRTPWHNGKVERSHRNDQERFYNYLNFYSFADLQDQMKRYLRHSNNIPMAVLGWKSPNQRQSELENGIS